LPFYYLPSAIYTEPLIIFLDPGFNIIRQGSILDGLHLFCYITNLDEQSEDKCIDYGVCSQFVFV
jgi:hypothetical protein